jgi:hypothetical protein
LGRPDHGTPAWRDPEQDMRAKYQRKQAESLLKRIRKRCERVGRCEISERLSERGEKRTTALSVSDTVPHRTPDRPSALLPPPPHRQRPCRPRCLCRVRRARTSRHGPRARSRRPPPRVTRPRLSRSPRRHPRPPPRPRPTNPKPEPTPKPELKGLSPAELQTRYGHSSDALYALLAHPALFAPLRRPRFSIVLCHGARGRGARAWCVELSVQGLCRAVRVRRARAGRVLEDAGALLEEHARHPAQHRRRGGVRHVRPAVRVSPSVHFSRAHAVRT